MKENFMQYIKANIYRTLPVLLAILISIFMFQKCEPEEKPVRICDGSDTGSCLYFLWIFGIIKLPQVCSVNAVLQPGDTKTFEIDPVYFAGGLVIRGCSSNPWTLTVTPPAGATVRIQKILPPCYPPGILLAQSASAGAPASISGPAGCMTKSDEAIDIDGRVAAGTVTVNFN